MKHKNTFDLRKILTNLLGILLLQIFIVLPATGQTFSPQSAMGDSFISDFYGFSSIEEYWGFKWEKGTFSNCSSNSSVNVIYNVTNERLDIAPLANTNGTNINGFRSRWQMNFQNSFAQVEVPTTSGDSVTELSVGTDCNNWYRIYRKGANLSFQSKTGGTMTTIATITYDLTLHKYWRIRHNPTNGNMVYETGKVEIHQVNGVDKEKKIVWTQRATTNVNFSLGQVRFEIVGGTDSSVAVPGLVTFDNFLFNSNSPEIIPPQQTVDTNYPTAMDGIVRNVTNCNQLQPTLDAAQPGDTVSLSPSLVCVGNYTFPEKSNPNNKWIIVRSASTELDSNGSLRAGRRINGENPSHNQQMPKLFTNNSGSVLSFPAGANYYRIVGVEVGIVPACANICTFEVYSLVDLEPSTNQVHHVIFDRTYVHGEYTPGFNVRRGIALEGRHLAVIDSSVSKIIDKERIGVPPNPPSGTFAQTQAILSRSGYGPIKIENNFLETLAQNILIGGDSSATPEQVIADIVIRRNYFVKRDGLYIAHGCSSDLLSCPDLPPTNGIEIKRGRRVQITENVFEQTLNGVYVKTTADGGCVNCISEYVNIENNKFKNVKSMISVGGLEGSSSGATGIAQHPNHITVKNNLSYFTDLSNSVRGYIGSVGIYGQKDIPDFRIIHNTYESEYTFWGTTIRSNLFNFEMRDNIFERRYYGLGGYEGVGQLNTTLFPWIFRRNILVNNSEMTNQSTSDSSLVAAYPCTNTPDSFCNNEYGTYIKSSWDSAESTGDQVGFQESSWASRRSTGNYSLSPNSSFKNAATDGTDIGVNQDVLDNATYGATTGIWGNNSQTPYPGPNTPNILSTIIEVENFDTGSQGIAYNENFGNTGSSAYRSNPIETVDITANSNASNGFAVLEAAAGEWLEYTVNVPSAGLYNFAIKYSSGYAQDYAQGKFRLEVCEPTAAGGVTNCVSSTDVTVNSTGGWSNFNIVKAPLYLPVSGTRILRLVMVSNAPGDTNCNCVVANFDAITVSNQWTLFDYDNDRKADVSVFRPTASTWYLQQSTNGFSAIQFGIPTDTIVPADYDGDGKTDIAIYRSSLGQWWIFKSSDSSVAAYQFGAASDLNVQGDYTGDGKADVALWRPSTGEWFILRSEDGSYYGVPFGTTGDIPAPGDYDGDGKFDFAVFRPSNATWYVLRSSNGIYFAAQFGANGDKVTPADYDGDGKTDIAVWRPSTGVWSIRNSSNGQVTSVGYGLSSDIPVPADFDGDSKASIAVWRPSNGSWYINNGGAIPFGSNGDVPTPSTYVR